MPHRILSLDVLDIRYPTVRLGMAGSDPRHLAPNYSCAITILKTDSGLEGRSLVFTIGAGTEIQKAAIEALKPFVVGRDLAEFIAEPGLYAQALAEHHQLRWLALGTYRMAVGGVINALWDLWAKSEGLPMWRLLTSLSPEKIVQCIDFHHLRDALTEDELLEMLRSRMADREGNLARLAVDGLRVYSTAGWSGRPLDEVRKLCSLLYSQGTRAFKAKVGRGQQYDRARALDEDRRMLQAIRESTGEDALLLTDANQNLGDWRNAASYMAELAEFRLLFIEEAIAYNDVLGYARLREALAPLGIGVAGGEQAPDAITFKQLLAGGGLTHCQIDGARVGGVNELFAIVQWRRSMACRCARIAEALDWGSWWVRCRCSIRRGLGVKGAGWSIWSSCSRVCSRVRWRCGTGIGCCPLHRAGAWRWNRNLRRGIGIRMVWIRRIRRRRTGLRQSSRVRLLM